MDTLRDFAEFLEALNRNGVRYVVIGAMAVLRHVPYRTTRDIDVLIEPTMGNAERAHRAVAEWGGFEPEFPPEDFISGDILSFGGLLRAEIHSDTPGASWDEVWKNRLPGVLGGVPTSFAGLDELISMKEATGRPEKDLPDLQHLRKLRDTQES